MVSQKETPLRPMEGDMSEASVKINRSVLPKGSWPVIGHSSSLVITKEYVLSRSNGIESTRHPLLFVSPPNDWEVNRSA